MPRTLLLAAALALGACDTIAPSDGPAEAFAERITGTWALAATVTQISPDGATAPRYGGPLTGGTFTVTEDNALGLPAEDLGLDFRSFALSPGSDWSERGYRPFPTRGGMKADTRVERVVFIGARDGLTDLAGTIEEDAAGRQEWAFYVNYDDGTTDRIVWTLTR